MFEFGSIVMTNFPFTNLQGSKLRPALMVSRDNDRRADVVLAYLTTKDYAGNSDAVPLSPDPTNGLKAPSVVRFDKLVTLEKGVVAGKIGDADVAWLAAARPVFFGVFGFGVT